MSELPSLKFNVGDSEIYCSPRNTALYRHLGHNACYDHVFIQDDSQEGEERRTGNILFLRPMLDEVKIAEVTTFMVNAGFEVHFNLREPAQGDVAAFDRMIEQRAAAIPDEVPTEWADGTNQD